MTSSDSLTWFRVPEGFSDIGGARVDINVDADGVPDIAAVVELVQGLLIYDVVAKPLYGVDLSPDLADAIHVRATHELLDLLGGCSPRPAAGRAVSHVRAAHCRVSTRGRGSRACSVWVRRVLQPRLVRGSLGSGVLARPRSTLDHG